VFLDAGNRIHVRPGAGISPEIRRMLATCRRDVIWVLQQSAAGRGISWGEWYLSLPAGALRNSEAQAA
jgi:hypothetical protein